MQLSEWPKMRKKWTTARDAAKPAVRSGAVKGISLGDSLDAVAKATGRNHRALGVAATKLIADLDKYMASIKGRTPTLVPWMEANLKKPALELQKAVASDLKAFKALDDLFARVDVDRDIWVPADLVRLSVDGSATSLKAAHPTEYKQFGEVVMFWHKLGERSDKIASTLVLDLPKDRYTHEIQDNVASIVHQSKVMVGLVTAAAKPGFDMALRPHTAVPDHLILYFGAARKATKRGLA